MAGKNQLSHLHHELSTIDLLLHTDNAQCAVLVSRRIGADASIWLLTESEEKKMFLAIYEIISKSGVVPKISTIVQIVADIRENGKEYDSPLN